MVGRTFVTAFCLAFSLVGCGSDDGEAGADRGGSGGATGGSGTTGGRAPACDGALAKVPLPYAPNTVSRGGRIRGGPTLRVFTAIADASLTVTQLLRHAASWAATSVRHDHALYGPALLALRNLILQGTAYPASSVRRLAGHREKPRSGEGAVSRGGNGVCGPPHLAVSPYYATGPFQGLGGIYGSSRPETTPDAAHRARGKSITVTSTADTLYWMRVRRASGGHRLPACSHAAAVGTAPRCRLPRQRLASETNPPSPPPPPPPKNPRPPPGFRASKRPVRLGNHRRFRSVVTRTPIGEAPVIVEDSGGLPIVIAEELAYYASRSGGIIKTSLSFASKTPIPGTAGRGIYSIALGPDDLWYSELSCIYRTAK